MKKLLNTWLPAKCYDSLCGEFKTPVVFALVCDGKPTLQMLNSGNRPEEIFEQFMFLELPYLPKQELEDNQESEDNNQEEKNV